MFDVGFWELTFCLIIALVVLGPEKLPAVARTLGRWTGRARAYVRNLTSELERETQDTGLKQKLDEARQTLSRETKAAADALRKISDDSRDGS